MRKKNMMSTMMLCMSGAPAIRLPVLGLRMNESAGRHTATTIRVITSSAAFAILRAFRSFSVIWFDSKAPSRNLPLYLPRRGSTM